MTFWERFYSLCIENNTKPNPVASQIGISSGTISGWKNGANPSTNHLKLISEFFNVSSDYLLGITDTRIMQSTQSEQLASEEYKQLLEKLVYLTPKNIQKVKEYIEFLMYQQK